MNFFFLVSIVPGNDAANSRTSILSCRRHRALLSLQTSLVRFLFLLGELPVSACSLPVPVSSASVSSSFSFSFPSLPLAPVFTFSFLMSKQTNNARVLKLLIHGFMQAVKTWSAFCLDTYVFLPIKVAADRLLVAT